MGRCSGMSRDHTLCRHPRHRAGWLSTAGQRRCATCHPPADPGLVAAVIIVARIPDDVIRFAAANPDAGANGAVPT